MKAIARTATLLALFTVAYAAASSDGGAAASEESPLEKMFRVNAAQPAPTLKASYGPGPQQTGQLRLPEGKGPFPVAIVIHGGCWLSEIGGSDLSGLSEMLRKRGVATWDIDYRRTGHAGGGWPGTFEDIAAAVDYLRTLANDHPLDQSRVATVGHSAGALFAVWAASRPGLKAPWKSPEGAPPIRTAVMIDGPSALAPFVGVDAEVCGRPVIVPFMGGAPAERPAEYAVASAATRFPLGVKQLFVLGSLGPLMKGDIDAARSGGDPTDVFAPPEPSHFDIVTPSEPNGEAVADWIVKSAF